MLFTDIPSFWLFLLFVVSASWFSRRRLQLNKFILIACSLLFFALYSLRDLELFLCVVLVNYGLLWIPQALFQSEKRRSFTVAMVVIDLLLLMYFKYFDFLIVQALDLTNLARFGPNGNRELYSFFQYSGIPDSVWSPLALSFYIFHIISYSLDVQQGKYRLSRFPDFLLYVSFFPASDCRTDCSRKRIDPTISGTGPIDWLVGWDLLLCVGPFLQNGRSRLDWSNNKSSLERSRRNPVHA